MSNEWEVVMKGGKHKTKPQLSAKEQKKIYQNNLNSNKYRLVFDEDTDKSLSPEQNKVPSKPKAKKMNVLKPEDDINKQINNIDGDKVKKTYLELGGKFPGQTTDALLNLADHLNLMIKITEESSKTLNFEKMDFPYVFLSKETKSSINQIFNGLSNNHIQTFLKVAIDRLLNDNDKGIPSLGLRILIQTCVRLKSAIFITNRDNFFNQLNVYRENTTKFKLIAWVLRQACSNFNMACQIWLIYLLPFISQKCHTEFVISFGEEMKNYPIDVTGNDTSLSVSDFVPIIDLIFIQNYDGYQNDKKTKRKQANFQLSSSQIERLKLIYLKIKDQAFLSKSPGALKDYFASLFLRLSINRNEMLNKELLDCLDHCLNMCPDSINQLSHLHVKYPQQTKIFLAHLTSANNSASAMMKKSKTFKSIMDKIHSTTLAAPTGSVQDNLRTLSKACKSQNHSSSFIGFFFRLLAYMFAVGVFMGFILYHQYPQQFRQLQRNAQPVIDWTVEKTTPVYRYLEQHFIEGYKHVRPACLIAMEKIKLKSEEFVVFISPYIDDLAVKGSQISNYVRLKFDEMFPVLMEHFGELFETIQNYLTDLVDWAIDFYHRMELQEVVQVMQGYLKTIMEQMEQGYRIFIDYASKIVGGQ